MAAGPARLIGLLAAALFGHAMSWASGDRAYPADIAAWGQDVKEQQRQAAKHLLERVQKAVADRAPRLRIEPGHYRFGKAGPTCFRLIRGEGLHIDATGATFWFEGRFRADSVQLRGCKNVALTGLTVDYDPLPYAQGEIVKVDPPGKCVEIRIDPGFPLPDATWNKKVGDIKAVFYGKDGLMIEVRMDWVQSLAHLGERRYRVTFKHGWIFDPIYRSRIRPGDRLCLPDRSMRHTFNIDGSEAVTLEDITVYACPQMAFTEVGGAGGHVYRRCKVVRRPGTNRLMACNADVFHSSVVAKGPLIERCEFSHSGDDFVNIHGFFFLVYEQRSAKEVVVVPHYSDSSFSVGSRLGFYRFGDLKPLGDAVVVRKEPFEGKDMFEASKRMPAELRQRGERIRDFHPRNIYPALVGLDRPLSVQKYDLVGCSDRAGNGAVLRHNRFHDGFSRGVLLKCSNAVVEHNTIERAGGASIAVAAERYWLEGPFARDVLISNNTIVDSGSMFLSHNWNTSKLGAITVISQAHVGLAQGAHNRAIRIVGNRILRPAACGIAVMNAMDCVVEGNTIERPFAKEPVRLGSSLKLQRPFYAIYLAAAEDITIKGNRVVGPSQHCLGEVGLGPGTARVKVEP